MRIVATIFTPYFVIIIILGLNFHEGPITCLATHPNPQQPLMLTGCLDSVSKISHTLTGKVLYTLKLHKESVEGVAFCKP